MPVLDDLHHFPFHRSFPEKGGLRASVLDLLALKKLFSQPWPQIRTTSPIPSHRSGTALVSPRFFSCTGFLISLLGVECSALWGLRGLERAACLAFFSCRRSALGGVTCLEERVEERRLDERAGELRLPMA